MTSNNPIHLLVRFSDNLHSIGNVISKHTRVIDLNGSVWFGKIGTPISKQKISIMNLQIENSIPTKMFLVKGNKYKSTFYEANLTYLTTSYPKEEKHFIPEYYFEYDLTPRMKFWAKLSEIVLVKNIEIEGYKVIGSVLSIFESTFRSSSGHFYIQEISK